jgi:hypothetical protein
MKRLIALIAAVLSDIPPAPSQLPGPAGAMTGLHQLGIPE